MDIEEKRRILAERISIVEEHKQIVQSNIDGGYQNKDGQPSFQSLVQDFTLQREALVNALNDLQ